MLVHSGALSSPCGMNKRKGDGRGGERTKRSICWVWSVDAWMCVSGRASAYVAHHARTSPHAHSAHRQVTAPGIHLRAGCGHPHAYLAQTTNYQLERESHPHASLARSAKRAEGNALLLQGKIFLTFCCCIYASCDVCFQFRESSPAYCLARACFYVWQ